MVIGAGLGAAIGDVSGNLGMGAAFGAGSGFFGGTISCAPVKGMPGRLNTDMISLISSACMPRRTRLVFRCSSNG
jgi:hypothetical protein